MKDEISAETQGLQVSPERLEGLVWGFAPPLVLEAAIHRRVFDVLDGGPKTVAEVASGTGASERGLRALLDALVGLELVSKVGERYGLTPESAAFLVSSRPRFLGGIFRHVSRQLVPNWLQLSECVRSGRPAVAVNREEQGSAFFQDFVEDLFPRGYPAARALAAALGVAEAREPLRVLDVAAGSGVWSVALAEASLRVEVTAADWPDVLAVTRRVAAERGLEGRYRFVGGDLLEVELGEGYGVAILGHILHSEGRERGRALLARVREALAPGGTVAIAEVVPNDARTGPPGALLFGVNMLVHTEQGEVFTYPELQRLLEEAGFDRVRTLEVPGPSPLVLADRPA